MVGTELQRFRLQYWSLPEFGRLLADAGFTDISVTADHQDDHQPGPDSYAWTFRAVTGSSIWSLLREGLAMKKSQELTWGQMAMAANAPFECMCSGIASQ